MAVLLHELKKTYVGPDGSVVPVIDVPALSIGDGEQIALIGTSGSGKTTLLHLIAGILAPDSGRILVGNDGDLGVAHTNLGLAANPVAAAAPSATLDYRTVASVGGNLSAGVIDVAALSEARRDVFRGRSIGYIFQTHHLLPGFTALENVLLGMSFTGRAADRPWAEHLLKEVGLADRLHYRPAKLSVGQQQRVAVARALANRPKLVLADEPTGALDEKNAQQVLDLIRKLCAEVQASLMLVTHDLGIARQLPRTLVLAEINRAARRAESTIGA